MKTTWIKTKNYPFGRFVAITHYPFGIFYKTSYISQRLRTHEEIHWVQQRELFVIFFYLIYLFEYLVKGYRNISFEKEASANEHNKDYLKTRKRFQMWR